METQGLIPWPSISDLQQIWQNLQRLTGTEVSGTAGQCGQRLQHEVWRVHRHGGLDSRRGRALHWGGRLLLPHWCRVGEPCYLGVWLPERPLHRGDRGHTGMDLAVPTGTPSGPPCPAPSPPPSTTAATATVMIDHGSGLSTLYAHNSQLLVRVGQAVETGDIVSLSGSTGRSTGPHLHFEVRVNGQRTNPRYYLPTTSYEE